MELAYLRIKLFLLKKYFKHVDSFMGQYVAGGRTTLYTIAFSAFLKIMVAGIRPPAAILLDSRINGGRTTLYTIAF